MLNNSSALVACLFGTPNFKWQGEILRLPTRKATALLCYLASEQRVVQREELTELLWKPTESRNLRRELYRLKQLPGAKNWLELDDGGVFVHVTTDLSTFIEAIEQQDFQKAIKLYQGKADEQLLAGLEPQNAPAFMDWLESKREELNTLLVNVLQSHIEELENAGRLVEAIEFTRQLLKHDPLDESIHRTIMRQEFKRGDLSAALKQYEVYRHMLVKELGMTPLPETLELAQEIEKAIKQPPPNTSQASVKTRHRIPPKLLRPPILVGREKEWVEMENAWQEGKVIIITGTAGSGKTRLMMDFTRSKSKNFGLNYGRPGDKTVPYSSLARSLSLYSNKFPSSIFEPWVRYELARLAPEIFEEKPLPATSLGSRKRLTEAWVKFFMTAHQIFDALITDDLHYFDEASFFTGSYVFSQIIGEGHKGQQIACYRKEEIPPDYSNHTIELAEKGFLAYIDLMPLDINAVTKLLLSLDVQQPQQIAPYLHKLTGGNPQFIVEILKSLYEQGWQGPEIPKQINLPKQVSSTIEKRLNYLSKDALRIVRVMSVLKGATKIQAKHIAEIVGMDYLKTSEVLAELEQAYIIKDGLFVHDLLLETALNTIPTPIYPALNQSVAKWLETQDAAPARIAHHWIEANESEQASPWRVRAAEILLTQGESEQANEWLEEVLAATDPESDLHKQARVLQRKLVNS